MEAATGDPVAVQTLLMRIRPAVSRYCRSRLGRDSQASFGPEDVAQEVCLAIFRALPAFTKQGGSFLRMAYVIASNKTDEALRNQAGDRADPAGELLDEPDVEAMPEERTLDNALRARLTQLLKTLPEQQREILGLRLVQGLSSAETANALGLSPTNVRVAQHRALTKLRALLRDEAIVEGVGLRTGR